jgi:flagellar protein FlaG
MNTMANVMETGYLRPLMPDGKRARNLERVQVLLGDDAEIGRLDSDGTAESGGDRPNLKEEIANLERISLAFNKKLQFVIDYGSKEVTVNVIDPDTDKVIKVLPPEELRRLNTKIEETIGFLFDEKV